MQHVPEDTAPIPASTVQPEEKNGMVLSSEGFARLLEDWNKTEVDYPRQVTLHQLIEAQVVKTPESPAVIFNGNTLTYNELNERANGLARELQRCGIGADVPVGVCAERSLEMVIALLAILKAGGAYMPLDPHYPHDRLAFMLADAKSPVLLTQGKLSIDLPTYSGQVIDLERFAERDSENPRTNVGPENLAYVIYTSGSTGQPKGVMSTHRGICNRLFWMQQEYQLTGEDRVLQKTPFTFDVSVWEFFWPLMTGAQLVVAIPGGHIDSAYLIRIIQEQNISTLHFVPSMLNVFLANNDAALCTSLKRVICSGEALPVETMRRFFDVFNKVGLHNLYGPTEASVDVTYWRCERGFQGAMVPIGRPVANTRIYILDEKMRPTGFKEGELHIGGVQLARGYLGRSELTAEKFVADPFSTSPEARLYKTGDLARFQPDGNILYLGRLDHQVKLRGFRIELGEIEATLASHPSVKQCVIVAREDHPGDKRLVAYVIAKDEKSGIALEVFLKDKLPDYMVPSAFVFLEAFPLSANGKLDRKALPAPREAFSRKSGAPTPPRNTTEQCIAGIWASVLGREDLGIQDSFFDAGGNSLKLVMVQTKLREQMQIDVPVATLFEHPTIAAFAEFLDKGNDTDSSAQERARKQREALARRREVQKAR